MDFFGQDLMDFESTFDMFDPLLQVRALFLPRLAAPCPDDPPPFFFFPQNNDAVVPQWSELDAVVPQAPRVVRSSFEAPAFIIPPEEAFGHVEMLPRADLMLNSFASAPATLGAARPASMVAGPEEQEPKKKRRLDRPPRHHSRKAYADIRPRIKGRFARKEEVDTYMDQVRREQEVAAAMAAAQQAAHQAALAAAAQARAPEETDDQCVPTA